MYDEEIHFRKLLLKQFEIVLEHLTFGSSAAQDWCVDKGWER